MSLKVILPWTVAFGISRKSDCIAFCFTAGKFTALAWANVSNGGVGIMLGHQDAMSSATELFKLGLVQVRGIIDRFVSR